MIHDDETDAGDDCDVMLLGQRGSSKAGMSILSGNIQSINAKFDEFSSFVDRINTHNPISAILLLECCINDNAIDSLALFNLKDYNMVYQSS